MDLLSETFLRYVRAKAAGRRRRDPALRQLGRRAVGRGLRGVRRALLGADPGRARGADDPLRHRDGAPARVDGGGGRRRHRPRLACAFGSGLGAGRARPWRPGEPRSGGAARAMGAGGGGRWTRSCALRADGRGTSSTSATGCCRTPTRRCFGAFASWCRALRLEDGGRPDGVRLARADRGHPSVSRGHPRGPAGLGRGGRGADRAVPADRRPLAARRDHRAAAGGVGAGARDAGLRGDEALAAADRRGGRGGGRGRRGRVSSASCSRRTTRALDRRLSRAVGGGARTDGPSSASSRAGTTTSRSSLCSRIGCGGRTRTWSSRRTRCRSGSSRWAIPTAISCSRRPVSSRSAPGSSAGRSRSRARARRASRGSGRTSSRSSTRCTTRGVRKVLVAPIGFVSDHLEILWDLDVEARERARELGLGLDRIESLNDDPAFIRALAELSRQALRVPSAA